MTKKQIDIDNLIKLAYLEPDEEEKKVFEEEIAEFLEYAAIINNADCENLTPASHAVEKSATVREDQARHWDRLQEMLSNGPVLEGSAYLVPPQRGRVGEEKEVEQSTKLVREFTDFETVIGLEIHAQLKTKSKLFCNCSTEFGKAPNENTCPVCSGQPGVLPVLNKEAVRMAVLAGLTMNCRINERSIFARKNYFYPDLPKGYQISQFEEPICSEGYVEVETDGKLKKIHLNRIHIEEDAGKMVHVGAPGIWGSKASAVDYNRSSVPLIEIVSEPDISSPEEAREFVIMLRTILVSLGICDGNLEEGSLRCDANVSIRPRGVTELGTKTEIKNMNSFKAVEKALAFEIDRQVKITRMGRSIEQETRLWDESSQRTHQLRSKEESHDYKYFPDPDLLPLIVEKEMIEELKARVPETPLEKKRHYTQKYNLPDDQARLLMTNPAYARYFEEILEHYSQSKTAANWFFNKLLSHTTDFSDIHISPADFSDFLTRIDRGEISNNIGSEVLAKAFEKRLPLLELIENEGFRQISDRDEIEKIVDDVIGEHPDQIREYRGGKTKVLGFLVGQVMRKSGGKANPGLVNQLLKKKL